MNCPRFGKSCFLVAVLIGSGLLAAYPVRAQTKEVQDALTARLLFASFYDQSDEMLGATLKPVGDALRAQLNIPAGQGLLVGPLHNDSPSAQAGLKRNDILLTLADKPLAAAADLATQLRAAGQAAVPLKLLRAGQPLTLQVRPVYRVTLGPVDAPKMEYYIGVSIDPIEDALRAQLALPANQGVVVTEVIGGSPAEKAGLKKHDIVLEMAGKRVDSAETLARQVQATQGQPAPLKLLRAGKVVTIPVTVALRKVESSPPQDALRLWMVGQEDLSNTYKRMASLNAFSETASARQRLEHLEKDLKALHRIEALEKELKALREAVEKINETLKAGK
jgi:serine protease Do